jgi:[ribosomal protein S5]-alanine N-acetyltransferase
VTILIWSRRAGVHDHVAYVGLVKPPPVLIGRRLNLVLISVAQLLSRDGNHDPIPLAYPDPYNVLHPARSPVRYRVAQVLENPEVNPWLLRLAVLRDTKQIVGLGNFHDAPDAHGMLEIGYSVLPTFRRQGFGREIAHTMWNFAAKQREVQVLRASVSPDNTASLAIVQKAGFVKVGEQDDPEDGLEYVFEISTSDYRNRNVLHLGVALPGTEATI